MNFAKARVALAPKATLGTSTKCEICVQYRRRLWVQADLKFPNLDTDSKKMPETACQGKLYVGAYSRRYNWCRMKPVQFQTIS